MPEKFQRDSCRGRAGFVSLLGHRHGQQQLWQVLICVSPPGGHYSLPTPQRPSPAQPPVGSSARTEWEFELGFIWAPTGLHRTLHVLCTHEITAVVISCLFILGRDQMMLIPLATRLSCCSGLTRGGLPWAEGRGSAWRSAQQSSYFHGILVLVRETDSTCLCPLPALSSPCKHPQMK